MLSSSKILRVSQTIFISSFVNPFSWKASICGMALKAICTGATEDSTGLAFSRFAVCPASSRMPPAPAPETAW